MAQLLFTAFLPSYGWTTAGFPYWSPVIHSCCFPVCSSLHSQNDCSKSHICSCGSPTLTSIPHLFKLKPVTRQWSGHHLPGAMPTTVLPDPAMVTFFQFPVLFVLLPATGPLHICVPLHGMFFPTHFAWLTSAYSLDLCLVVTSSVMCSLSSPIRSLPTVASF